MKTDLARSRARKARRVEKAAENLALSVTSGNAAFIHTALSQSNEGPIAPKSTAKAPPRRLKPKKAPSRKSLVKKADTAFSLHIRALYPTSFFSGKPTECCFHIITRSKHSVRWALDNAVGSTMGENYEMEFNPHKFITALIRLRGLLWYEALVRRSNETRKFTRDDLTQIAARGHDETATTFAGEVCQAGR